MSGVDGCGSDHCVTCSDEAVPMVVAASGPFGVAVCVDPDGARNEVMVDLVGPVSEGDEVLVHAGVALSLLTVGAERLR